ncbi:MAG TPA: hypothetical protein VJN69_02620 [Candidatus Acidoferrales bacterium]|nr:hypothetical protein [Candidatus Acidoferrales bacterium]
MKLRETTTLYATGIVVAALAGFMAVMPPAGTHSDFEVTAPPFISGSQLPAMLDSADTKCGNQRQCSEYEFNGVVSDLERQWAITPEWVRLKCAANTTVPSMEHCIVQQTQTWLGRNANRQAPWVKREKLGTVAQYAALGPTGQPR